MAQIIYIPLEEEGIDVWRPALADRNPDGSFHLLPDRIDDDDEIWRYPPGSDVVVAPRLFSDDEVLAAVCLASR